MPYLLFLSCSISLFHTHSLSLSLFFTHIHKHTHSLSPIVQVHSRARQSQETACPGLGRLVNQDTFAPGKICLVFVPDERFLDLGQRWRRIFSLEILEREDRGDEARLDLACQLACQASAAVHSLNHSIPSTTNLSVSLCT